MIQSPKHVEASDKSDAVSTPDKPNLSGDRLNLLLLMLLFMMQGIPLGLAISAIPIILESNKSVSYEDQALFSLVLWPSSIKLLWAPLVDAFYVKWMGRRKSWLLPVQYLIGALFFYMANNINDWLPETGKPNVTALTNVFFILMVLVNTHDIVVNGWTLTMMKKANVSYASSSGPSGISIGVMLGSVVPILITSENFSNKYLRFMPGVGGIMNLERFLFVWGIIFMLVPTLIGIFKKEKDNRLEDNYVQLNIVQNYKLLWDILKLPSIRLLLIALLTLRVGFSAMRITLVNLRLVDAGVPKDGIMILSLVMFIVKIVTPLAVSKYTSGPKPMSICMQIMPIRLLWGLTYIILIHYTPMMINWNGVINVPIYYYFILGFLNAMNEAFFYIMLVAMLAFFSRISDSRFGGTYMTLLNTVVNLGTAWSSSLGLHLIEFLTLKNCSNNSQNNCSTTHLQSTCGLNGGKCLITVDGFFVEIIVCIVIGFVWYGIFKNILERFQTKSQSHWLVYANPPREETEEASNGTSSN